jgi:hypothetical protein
MSHDAEYFRLRRREQGIRERDPIHHPRFIARGQELTSMMQEPLLLLAHTDPAKCANGCGKPHKNNVTLTKSNMGVHKVFFCCSWKCKHDLQIKLA